MWVFLSLRVVIFLVVSSMSALRAIPESPQEPGDGVLATSTSACASHACFDPVLASLFLIFPSTSGVFFQGWVNTVVEMRNDELDTDFYPTYGRNPTPNGVSIHDICVDPTKVKQDAG